MKQKFILSLLFLGLFSCQNDGVIGDVESIKDYTAEYEVVEPTESDQQIDSDSTIIVKFTYKGKSYEGLSLSRKAIQFEDQAINSIFNKLKNTPNIAIYVNADKEINFCDSYNEMDAMQKLESLTRINTRSLDGIYIKDYIIRVWDKDKGRSKGGASGTFEAARQYEESKSPKELRVPSGELVKAQLYKKISSCQMWAEYAVGGGSPLAAGLLTFGQYKNATVTFFEGEFSGRSVTFTNVYPGHSYGETDYFGSFDFDNVTGSFIVKFNND